MLRAELNEALKEAMRARGDRATTTIRLALAALKDRDIAERGKGNVAGLDDGGVAALLQSMIKQRHESIRMYEQGGRDDLARQESEEIAVLQRFLPEPMSEGEMAKAVAGAIEETKAASLKDMGRVMSLLKERFPGRMDFALASSVVRQKLGA